MSAILLLMGRPRAKIDTHGEAAEVLVRLQGSKGWQRERLLVIKQALEGAGTVELAKKMSRSHTTVQDWIDRFREGGIERLLSKKKGNGPQSALTEEMRDALGVELAKGKWRTAAEAWQWLEENFDMSGFSQSSIYYILGKCGGRLKVARPSNPKKDPEKEEEFRTTLAEKLKELDLPADRPVRLWVYDEMRYGLHPLTRRMWSLKGVRAIAPSRRSFKFGYVYGALQVGGSGSEFLFTPHLNKEWDRCFLRQIGERDPYAVHVVIGDGAGFHHRHQAPGVPDNVRILTLPPYCPELNPVEKLWDVVKDGICNRDWPSLDALEDALTARLKPYWEDSRRVMRLIGSGYLLSELNAS